MCAVHPRPRVAALTSFTAALVAVLVFLQNGYMMKDHNPTIRARYFFRVSPMLADVLRVIGDRQSLFLGPSPPYGNVNMMYGYRSITSNDAMWVRDFIKVYAHFLDNEFPYLGVQVKPRSLRALQVMGIQNVLIFDLFPFGAYPFTNRASEWEPNHL